MAIREAKGGYRSARQENKVGELVDGDPKRLQRNLEALVVVWSSDAILFPTVSQFRRADCVALQSDPACRIFESPAAIHVSVDTAALVMGTCAIVQALII